VHHRQVLHDPARHEPLAFSPWNESRACDAIERIVRDAEARFSPDAWWPAHPREVPPEVAATPATALYSGGIGMVWALRYLRDAALSEAIRDSVQTRLARRECPRQTEFVDARPMKATGKIMRASCESARSQC
jgi:acyl-CoA synthetase (AMP-forming)/AMP-acid ligase II